jgi:hypothetical protein
VSLEEWERPDFDTALEEARSYLDRLSAGDPLGPANAEHGECDECGEEARDRWLHGAFTLCRRCRRRRLAAAAQLLDSGIVLEAEREPLPEPEWEGEEPPPPELPTLPDLAPEWVGDEPPAPASARQNGASPLP